MPDSVAPDIFRQKVAVIGLRVLYGLQIGIRYLEIPVGIGQYGYQKEISVHTYPGIEVQKTFVLQPDPYRVAFGFGYSDAPDHVLPITVTC